MDPLGHARSAPAQGAKEGLSKPAVPQKNAYARLVQKHHSGRFRSYMNRVAQKMQLEESTSNEHSSDLELPLRRGLVKENLARNGLNVRSYSPVRASHLEQPGGFENDKPQTLFNRCLHRKNASVNSEGDWEVEEDCYVHRHGAAADSLNLSDAMGRRVSTGLRHSAALQKSSGSDEKDEEDVWRRRHKKRGRCPANTDMAAGHLLTEHFSGDVLAANARRTSLLSAGQVQGEFKVKNCFVPLLQLPWN